MIAGTINTIFIISTFVHVELHYYILCRALVFTPPDHCLISYIRSMTIMTKSTLCFIASLACVLFVPMAVDVYGAWVQGPGG